MPVDRKEKVPAMTESVELPTAPRAEAKRTQSPREGLTPTDDRPASIPIAGRAESVNRTAWESGNTFSVTKDDQGRTTRIEGTVSLRTEKRTVQDARLQSDAAAAGPRADNRSWDGGHLIAHSLGGPSVETHGIKLATANLVAMEARMNRSYVAQVEKEIRARLKAEPNAKLFLQADVTYSKEGHPRTITHRLISADGSGRPEGKSVFEVSTRLDVRAAKTQAAAIKDAVGESGSAFFRPGQKGTVGPVQ